MSKVQFETYEFGPRFSETILNEMDRRYSRAEVEVAASDEAIPFGTVLARNEDGKYAPLAPQKAEEAQDKPAVQNEDETATPETPASTEASQPRAILIQDLPANDKTQTALVIRGYSIVNGARLVLPDGVDRQKIYDALEDIGFVVKDIPATDWEEE